MKSQNLDPLLPIERWDPLHEIEDLSARLSRLFGVARRTNGSESATSWRSWTPSADISETEKTYEVRADLPQVKKEDVHVTLEDNILSISGERRETHEEKSRRFHRRELSYGRFERRFAMPGDVDPSGVEAAFKDGTLTVTIKKAASAGPKAKEIAIH